jgi:hypothetical protein
MDDVLAQWLALREPIDAAARSARLTRAVVDAIGIADPVNVLDLATGTGSNLRYLMNRLPRHQRWLVIDRSSTLLAQIPVRTASWGAALGYEVVPDATAFVIGGDQLQLTDPTGFVINGEQLDCHVQMQRLDLEALEAVEVFADRHLVTASALLDLVSESWLRSLADCCRAARAAALFTITYNGYSSCSPVEPEDQLVLDLFNRHQRTDKGLGGPAAGPGAVACAERCFAEAGYRVEIDPSDWKLGVDQSELQRQLIEGWAEAAAEISPAVASTIADWRVRRLHHVDIGDSRLVVGHYDLAAWPL